VSGFLQRLKREHGGDLAPLERLAKAVGKELEDFAFSQGKMVVSEIQKAARRARVPLPYLFWTLVEQPQLWPPLDPKKKSSLNWAVFLMEESKATPNYASGFQLPDEGDEPAVEDVITAAATWAHGPLWGGLLRKYMAILDAKKGEAAKLLGTSTDDARARLESTFLVAVNRHPRWFRHTDLLAWVVRLFLK